MVSARTLSRQGYKVSLVERAASLGGQALNLYRTWKGDDIQKNLSDLVRSVESDSNIDVHLNTELINVEGFVGNFKTTLSKGAQIVEHGIAVLSTGAKEFKPDEYFYGSWTGGFRITTHR
jgi:heterodisulfide reductase subunit A